MEQEEKKKKEKNGVHGHDIHYVKYNLIAFAC